MWAKGMHGANVDMGHMGMHMGHMGIDGAWADGVHGSDIDTEPTGTWDT